MAIESTGEWKLVKVWECNVCKLLIKDGRNVFDHTCTIKDKKDEISSLKNIINDKSLALEERDKFIDSQKVKIDSQKNKIDGLNSFIEELNGNIEDYKNTIRTKDGIIEEQRTVIDNQKKTIINQETTIDEQKKNQNKVIEKVVYIERNASRTVVNQNIDTVVNQNIDKIDVDIWKKDFRIKDEKDNGYREEIEFEIFERGKGREKIIIKNGKVIKKPDDIIIIGEHTSGGFIVKGIYRN